MRFTQLLFPLLGLLIASVTALPNPDVFIRGPVPHGLAKIMPIVENATVIWDNHGRYTTMVITHGEKYNRTPEDIAARLRPNLVKATIGYNKIAKQMEETLDGIKKKITGKENTILVKAAHGILYITDLHKKGHPGTDKHLAAARLIVPERIEEAKSIRSIIQKMEDWTEACQETETKHHPVKHARDFIHSVGQELDRWIESIPHTP